MHTQNAAFIASRNIVDRFSMDLSLLYTRTDFNKAEFRTCRRTSFANDDYIRVLYDKLLGSAAALLLLLYLIPCHTNTNDPPHLHHFPNE
jgi:hypothetical protein